MKHKIVIAFATESEVMPQPSVARYPSNKTILQAPKVKTYEDATTAIEFLDEVQEHYPNSDIELVFETFKHQDKNFEQLKTFIIKAFNKSLSNTFKKAMAAA